MSILIDKNIDSKEKVKSIVLEFLDKNEIPYSLTENDDCESICIDLNFDSKTFKSDFYYAPLMIETSDKDICKVYPYEIMHIAIEDRESVLYLIDKKLSEHLTIYLIGRIFCHQDALKDHTIVISLT